MTATPSDQDNAQTARTAREIRAERKDAVTRIRYRDLALGAAHGLGFVILAIGVLDRSPFISLAGAVVALGSQFAITGLRSPINRAFSYLGISRATRMLLLVLLVLLLQVTLAFDPDKRPGGFGGWHPPVEAEARILPFVAAAAAFCYLAVLFFQARGRGYGAGGLAWRGFADLGLPDSPAPYLRLGGNQFAIVPTSILSVGLLVLLARGDESRWLLVVAAAATAASVLSGILSLVRRLQLRREGVRSTRVVHLREALDRFAPEVAFYLTAPANGTYAMNVWLKTAEAFTTRTVIVLGEASHLANLEPTSLPVIVAPRARDIEYLTVGSIRVILHPTTGNKVYQLMRLRGLTQIFIGHGDSDKVSSFNPYTRIFDEIWVSGPAGIDRYRALGEGFRTEQFLAVGRPQLGEISMVSEAEMVAGVAARPTVLYAPTWEGFLEQSNYSSLATMGVPMVKAMLAMPNPPRILFKPHPSSGHRRPDMLAAQAEITRLLTEAGSDHEVYGDGTVSLYAAFNSADTMITDISSVLTDFLASHKPYLVTNPRTEPITDFLLAFPSAAAGTIVDADLSSQRGGDFVAAIELALTGDVAGSPERIALSEYLLGPAQADPVASFASEVAQSVERARERYPYDREVPLPPDIRIGDAAGGASDAAELDSARALS